MYIIEVKGKKDYANLDDLRQLLDWYMRQKSKDETKNIKGIFIVKCILNKWGFSNKLFRKWLVKNGLKIGSCGY